VLFYLVINPPLIRRGKQKKPQASLKILNMMKTDKTHLFPVPRFVRILVAPVPSRLRV